MKQKKTVLSLMAVILLLSLVACGPSQNPGTQSGDIPGSQVTGVFPGSPYSDMVVLDTTSEPANLNSMMVSDVVSSTILQHTMAGLTRLDATDKPVSDIAESWEINDDKTIYTMHLRKDAQWTNGEPVTANDFYYSWVTQMNPETGAPLAQYLYDNIKNGKAYYEGAVDEAQLGIKVLDDYTLQIEWSRPMTDGLFFLTQPTYLPINQKAYEEIGAEQYAKDAGKIVTNGPYTLAEWVHDDNILLEKNEDYYDAARINIPKVKLLMISDANTRINAFMAGEMDMANVYSSQIEQVKAQAGEAIETYIDGGSWYFSFNMEDPQLSNRNLRKALAYSVDIQSLLDNVIADGSVVANGLVPNIISGVDEKPYAQARGNVFSYDPEAALQYLNQALEELGIAVEDLSLSLSVHDSTYNQNQAAYLQQQWKEKLGLEIEIKILPYKALVEAKSSGDFQIGIDGWGPSENDAITYLEVFKTGGAGNNSRYSNPEYDALINSAYQESNPAKRQEAMLTAENILMEDMVVGPMYFTSTSYVVSDKLEGLVRTPFQAYSVTNGARIVP